MVCRSNLCALRHTVHGQLWVKNDWQFSNPRIYTSLDLGNANAPQAKRATCQCYVVIIIIFTMNLTMKSLNGNWTQSQRPG